MPWKIAFWTWIGCSIVAIGLMLAAIARVAAIRFSETRGFAFLATSLALAPLHTGIANANASITAIALSVLGFWCARPKCDVLAGILLAGSTCLKPPIGMCFLFYFAVSRRWKVVSVGLGTVALTALVAGGRMWMSGLAWINSYRELTQQMFTTGSVNDFTTANPVWFQMLNLQGPFYALSHNARIADIAAILSGTLLISLWVYLMRSAANRPCSLLAMSALAVLSLLPMYHRFYDASLLILPVAWAFAHRNRPSPKLTYITIALVVPFLVPGAAALSQVSDQATLVPRLFGGSFWNAFLIGHEVWFLFSLSLILLYGMRHAAAQDGEVDCSGDEDRLRNVGTPLT